MGAMEIFSSLSENPYFGAGFGLFGVGAAASIGRKSFQSIVLVFKRHYVTTLGMEILCKELLTCTPGLRSNVTKTHLAIQTRKCTYNRLYSMLKSLKHKCLNFELVGSCKPAPHRFH